MLFRGAVESADGLVSSCRNHTDIRSIVPKRPQADVTNASPFDHCWHRCCFPFAEQPIVSQPEKREYTRVIGHNIDVFIVLVDERCDQSVDVATMFTCTLFPPHRICIVCMWVIFFADDNIDQPLFVVDHVMIVSMYVGRFVSIVRLIVWLIAAAPLLVRFDKSFVTSIEYCYTYGSSLSLWSYAECVGSSIASRFHGRWRRQVPCSSRSSCPVYVIMAPTYFPQAPVTVEESWRKWRQLETEVYRGRANGGRHLPSQKLKVVCRKV